LVDGLQAQELGRLAGLSHGMVGLIESGSRDMGGKSAPALAEVLGVSLDWLLLGRGKAPSRRAVAGAVLRASLKQGGAAA
jgi:transcriptional regulator with XRE-family HTH domain